MDWKAFLTDKAISNYIVFIAGLIVGLLVHLFKNIFKKPDLVELEKQKETSLISLSDEARDRLIVTYEDQPVHEFHQTLLEIRNKADKAIEDVELKLYLDTKNAPQKLYEIKLEDPLEELRISKSEVKCVVQETGEHFIRISFPFINSYKRNKDQILLKIYSPKPIKIIRLVGGGKGWNSKFFDRVEYNEKLDRILRNSPSFPELIVKSIHLMIFKKK
ncbi:MAG: hypothetical protein GY749_44245 [Desulfobacteraceae bacterium]|nr:hypothetical protein [Desulfobacteraceae bacterium]